MLKFEGQFKLGDRIKAFDFEPMEGRPDRFVVGQVTAIGYVADGYKAYTIRVEEDSTAEGLYSREGHDVFVPMEVSIFEYDNRVTLVGAY